MNNGNVGTLILSAALRHPQRLALRIPRPGEGLTSDSLSYAELLGYAARLQQALQADGWQSGQRVLLLARPGLPLYAVLLALLGLGLVPVLLDRGMSRARMLGAIAASGASGLIGQRDIVKRWWLLPQLWRLRRYCLDGACFGARGLPPDAGQCGLTNYQFLPRGNDDHGLISFTSGSTGAPKGADRTHASLIAQHLAIRNHWPDQDDEIDMPCFPVLVLHNLCCGISSVLPAVDLATPGQVDAALVLEQIRREGVTRLSGAPAYMQRLVEHAQANGLQLPQVRSLVIGGSTVNQALLRGCLRSFPQAWARVVYGSTEAEPIAEVEMSELLQDWHQQPGYLLGNPAAVAEVCIVDPQQALSDAVSVERARLPAGQVGEILVAGPHVLKAYVNNPQACAECKIPRADGLVWHRTGDCGAFDERGRLWLHGRLKDRVLINGRTQDSFILEKALDALPGIIRSAVLNALDGQPLVVLQGEPQQAEQLPAVLEQFDITRAWLARIAQMPVDGRHNSKIDRPALRQALKNRQLACEALP